MGVRFYLKGTSLDAHVSYSGKTAAPFGNVVDDPAVVTNSNTGVFGSSVISFIATSVTKGLIYPGLGNICDSSNGGGFSVRARIVPSASGSPFTGFGVLQCGHVNGAHGRAFRVGISATGHPYVQLFDLAGNTNTFTGTSTINATINVPFDFMCTWDGSTTSGKIKFSVDGVETETLTSTVSNTAGRIQKAMSSLVIGSITAGPTAIKASINDLKVWDTVENHVYSTRTDFDNDAAFDGLLYTDPTEAKVETGTGYTFAGVAKTGTYDGSNRWSDPTEAYVSLGVQYKANSLTNNKTGALDVAAQVWDKLTSAITTSGSIGKLLKDNIDAKISDVKAKTDNLPSDPADASVIAAATDAIIGYVNTEVADIKAKTDNLPSDPADQSAVEAYIDAAEADIIAAIGTGGTPTSIADAVWNALTADHTVSGSFGVLMKKLLTLGKFLGLK